MVVGVMADRPAGIRPLIAHGHERLSVTPEYKKFRLERIFEAQSLEDLLGPRPRRGGPKAP